MRQQVKHEIKNNTVPRKAHTCYKLSLVITNFKQHFNNFESDMKQILKAMFTSPQTIDISQYLEGLYKMNDELAGADPGFSIGGGTNPLGGTNI